MHYLHVIPITETSVIHIVILYIFCRAISATNWWMGENNEGLLGKSDGAGKRLFREMPSTEGVSEIKLFVGVGWVVGNQQVTQGSILIN